jgi:hypothetical protein
MLSKGSLRASLRRSLGMVVALSMGTATVHAADEPDTRTLSELRADLDARKTTSVELVEAFTRRTQAGARPG